MNSSLEYLDATQNYYGYTNESDSYENAEEISLSYLGAILWLLITLITCCIGFVGNGYIIWLLGFQIKRNSFTTFILHLAIADSVYLTSVFIYYIDTFFTSLQARETFDLLCIYFMRMTYTNANFLLTAISMDRCVAVLFPIWHRCSRPKHLSTTVCVLLWISSFLLCGIMSITKKNQGQLLLMIFITLLCFLILAFPFCVLTVIISFSSTKAYNKLELWFAYSILFSCLNSSINPVIYFLVGRKKRAQTKESMKVILQKVFKEAEVTGGR
ncbi:mas-related G-protein coupled receptor member H-like [Notechis scutatus]|uniref:Mas-related G-protein coupled receptor member H-like n=1 Tax=Notechis scutatus TaxID=8663 RepID=A0A6J1W6W8_9SAUR|nr:mas-related G-protein coupled receptor member H-like [Notechis scutatus]